MNRPPGRKLKLDPLWRYNNELSIRKSRPKGRRLGSSCRKPAAGAGGLCSSRDGGAFALGVGKLLSARRSHAVLNSLSADLIPSSLALLAQMCGFEELGKRGVWSVARVAAVASVRFGVLALDVAMALEDSNGRDGPGA